MTLKDEMIQYTDEELEEIDRIIDKVTAPLDMSFADKEVTTPEEPETSLEDDFADLGDLDEISDFSPMSLFNS